MGNFYYWIPTVVAGLLLMLAALILQVTVPKHNDRRGKNAG